MTELLVCVSWDASQVSLLCILLTNTAFKEVAYVIPLPIITHFVSYAITVSGASQRASALLDLLRDRPSPCGARPYSEII